MCTSKGVQTWAKNELETGSLQLISKSNYTNYDIRGTIATTNRIRPCQESNLDEAKKSNGFVRSLIVLLCAFLAALITYRFFFLDPAGDLSPGVLTVLALLVALVLSESFDSFSIGELISLKKEVQKKQTEISATKQENAELRGQIITIATNMSQHQTSTNIVALPELLVRSGYSIKPAPDEEVKEKQAEEIIEKQSEKIIPHTEPIAPEKISRKVDSHRLEEKAIEKFLIQNNFTQFPIAREIKLMAQFEVADPISTSGPIFDAYLNTLDTEIFVEVRPGNRNFFVFRDRLYMMLSKLYHYKLLKKSNVYLSLVITTLPSDDQKSNFTSRILSEFQPAIANGLLKIIEINFTAEEEAELFSNEGNPVLP